MVNMDQMDNGMTYIVHRQDLGLLRDRTTKMKSQRENQAVCYSKNLPM